MAGLDIAIVGLACRLPGGVEDLSGVWDALRADTDQLRVGPGSRRVGELGEISARGGWLADACWTRFDHRRFRISPAEARSLEPRQRLLLKLCWEALEASLQAPLAQEGSRSGVFLGTGPSDWGREAYAAGVELDPFTGTGHFASVAAGRIAYTLGLVGPALSVQTACSSSLVALHLACRELASGRVGQAIVGAVNGLMATEPTRYFARLGALSPSGRSHPFDRSADGYVRAEGGVVLILRPREEALALGLPVLGVIRGTAVNQDGRSNGLTAPSGRAQEDVLRAALADASVSPAEVAHIEAHGTGTPLGDPIELRALDSVFGVNAPTIHAAKARFGHLECAAGLVGVVSALSALEHRVAPAVLGLETTNPRAGQLRIKLPRRPAPLGSGLVGVSSFGLSGTNAHVLIESGQPRSERPEPAPGPRLASGWAPETVRIVPDDPESALTSRVATSHGPWRRVDDGGLVHALRRPEPVLVIGSGADVRPVLEWLRAHGVEPERAIAVDDAPSVALTDCVRTSMGQLEHVLHDEGERDTVWLSLALGAVGGPRSVEVAMDDATLAALWSHGFDVRWPTTVAPRVALPRLPEPAEPRLPLHPVSPDGVHEGWTVEWIEPPSSGPSLRLNDTPECGRPWLVVDPGGTLDARLSYVAACLTRARAAGATLWIATRGATPEAGATDAVAAGLWGWAATAALEEPEVFGGIVDVAEGVELDGRLSVPEDRVVVLSAGARVPRLRRRRTTVRRAVLEGTWVVAGGTGALGRRVTEWLRERGAARVIALARRQADVPGCEMIAVDALDALAVERALQALGPIEGVVHAAGALERDSAHSPSTRGGRVTIAASLDAVTPGARHIALSSVAGLWGGRRLAGYAAASAELDAWACARGWSVIRLGPWGTGGMVPADELAAMRAAGVLEVTAEALDTALDLAVAETGLHCLAPLDEEGFARAMSSSRPQPWLSELSTAGSSRVVVGPVEARAAVRDAIQDVLGRAIPDDLGFFDAGLGSVEAVALAEAVERALKVRVPATAAFDHPTVDALVDWLCGSRAAERSAPGRASAPVAIVGVAIRLPGADDLDGLAGLLRSPTDALRAPERWDPAEHEAPRAGFVDGLEDFEPEAFRMSAREAVALDPQQRMILELTREVIARGSCTVEQLRARRTGVFVGLGRSEYWDRQRSGGESYAWSGTGNAASFAAGRVAHAFGFEGPALVVDTACSSALVALHLAVRALRSGECGAAIVAGANALLSPESFRYLESVGALSPTGACRPFDAHADGYARAEGAGALLLIADAEGFTPLATVRGTAIAHDGLAAGLTVPSGPAQERVIRAALEDAGLTPDDVDAIEAHGTGTPLGDPIEIAALSRVFGERSRPLRLTAVKRHTGHLEAAAGLAGIAAALVAMQEGCAPLLLDSPNPELAIDWPVSFAGGPAQRIGVSSFGMSGTNAHVVLELSERVEHEEPEGLVLRTASALHPESALAHMDWLDGLPETHRVAATSARHTAEPHRIARVGDRTWTGRAAPLRVGLLFTGQGSQSAGMGQMLSGLPGGLAALEALASAVPEVDVRGLLLDPERDLVDTASAQPALVALELVLADVLRDIGVEPVAVLGHSIGELAAAAVAGAMSSADAVRLAAARGRLMAATPAGGSMVAVRTSTESIVCAPGADIAAVNAPNEVVISGTEEAVAATLASVEAPQRSLRVSHAFHAPGMDEVVAPLAAAAATLSLGRPRLTVLSPAEGGIASEVLADPAWWGQQARARVQFTAALSAASVDLWLEIGPRPVLTGLAARCGLEALHLARVDDPYPSLLGSLAELWTRGVPVDRTRLVSRLPSLHLPPAPLRRRRLWLDEETAPAARWGLQWEVVEDGAEAPAVAITEEDPASAVLQALEAVRQGARLLAVPDDEGHRGAAAVCGLAATLSVEEPESGIGVIRGAASGGPAGSRLRDGRRELPRLVRLTDGRPYEPSGRWLVTGGLGALGRHVVSWLEASGAEVYTCGRTAHPSPSHHAVDVADAVAVGRLLDALGPLAGIVHCAGVVEDGLARDLDEATLGRVLAAKVSGAEALSAHHEGPLVVFGSATAWFGRVGQAAYGAANAAVEAVIRRRRASGRPGVCLAWGPWGEGMAVDLAAEGVRTLSPRRAVAALARGLDGPPVQLVFEADWELFAQRWLQPPSLLDAWVSKPSPVEHVDLPGVVRDAVRRVLGDEAAVIDDVGFFDLGLDSIMAVELSRLLSQQLGRPLSATLAFEHPRVDLLIAYLAGDAPQRDAVVSRPTGGAIAIVGAACRYPGGVDSPEALWRLLQAGRAVVGTVPAGRFEASDLPVSAGFGAFLDEIDQFDAEAFGIAPREAASLDPQQRLLLETCSAAVDVSGVAAPARTGIYVGIAERGYLRRFASEGQPFYPDGWSGTGNESSFAAGRVAHALGLEGPAVALNTTCSSSLVAVDLAVRSLRDGTCDAAIAAGVHLVLDAESSDYLARLGALSPTGRCHTFDARADGYVRGEGAAALVLKRLEDAEVAGDPILAIIRGTATNHDGRSSGLTVPSGRAQEAVIRAAWADAGLDPVTCDVLQAHGTGTPLGDPIEINAARSVFLEGGRQLPLAVRTAKTNLGHGELVAGLTGLLDAVLCLRHREVPAPPDLREPNPVLVTDGLELRGASLGEGVRRAGVSAFGLSGTNAHVVLESAPTRAVSPQEGLWLHPLSAPSADGVRALAAVVTPGAGAARGLANRRRHAFRAGWVPGTEPVPVRVGGRPKIAFLFTGQGAQYAGMASGLYRRYPVFRDALDACAAELAPEVDLHAVLGDDESLRDTRHTQPAMFALGWALAALLRSWGITPDVVAGHSVGEWTAAAVAGGLDLTSAARGIALRGALMSDLPSGGAMLAVRAPVDDVVAVVGGAVDVAAINHPSEVVLSGAAEAIAAARSALESEGHRCTPLRVSHAFHSARMAPMLDAWGEHVAGLSWRRLQVPLVSALTGAVEDTALQSPAFWMRHAREAVRWRDAVETLRDEGVDVFIELGPHPVLVTSGQATVDEGAWVGALRRGGDDVTQLLAAVGALWARGAPVDWDAMLPSVARPALPPTPLQRSRHWLPGDRAALPAWTYTEVWDEVERVHVDGPRMLLGDASLADDLGATPTEQATGAVVDARWLGVADPEALSVAVAGILELAREVERLWVVTRGARTDPFQAALWGLARCLFVECPQLRGGVVDLAGGVPALPAHEAVSIGPDGWFTPRLERVSAPSTRAELPGTWLITGGTGAIGRAVTRWLASRGATTLHVVGRRPLPDDPDDPRARLAREVPGVVLHQCDVSDRAAVAALLAQIDGPFGVYHAAGVTHPQAVEDADPETIRRTLAPKVAGAWWLHTLTAEREVPVFVSTGSIAAAWGSRDLCAYAAANRFLDGLASARRAAGLSSTTLSYGPWEGGMMDAAGLELLARMGQQPLPASTALALTGAFLDAEHSGVVVARVDWERFGPLYDSAGNRDYLDRLRPREVVESTMPVEQADRWSLLEGSALESAVRDVLQERARAVLRRDEVPLDRPLIELGFDSLMATELKNVLLTDGLDVPLGRLLGGPSIDELVGMTLPRLRPPVSEPDPVAEDDGDIPSWMVWSHAAAIIVGAGIASGLWALLG